MHKPLSQDKVPVVKKEAIDHLGKLKQQHAEICALRSELEQQEFDTSCKQMAAPGE
uniref:Uncharacterized protein n=1 Tax=Salvator merianae TaxID=96440 RepID=A0A8D0C261_SALMN